jgi:hypothetical protein
MAIVAVMVTGRYLPLANYDRAEKDKGQHMAVPSDGTGFDVAALSKNTNKELCAHGATVKDPRFPAKRAQAAVKRQGDAAAKQKERAWAKVGSRRRLDVCHCRRESRKGRPCHCA